MVLVVGQNSVWQKTYRFTRIERGRVNRVESLFESAAGKGTNVCRSMRVAGEEAELLAYVGGGNGEKFERACTNDGLDFSFVHIGGETRICTTLIESDTTTTELVEPAPEITDRENRDFRERFLGRIGKAELLIISGTAMKGEDPGRYFEFITEARRHGIAVLLDSYKEHGKRALAAQPEVLKINQDELAELSGRKVESSDERIAAYEELLRAHGLRWIVVTRGAQGAEGYNGSVVAHVEPPDVRSINPIGSGDSVTSGIAVVLLRALRKSHTAWDDNDVFVRALVEGVAMGTANCLNIKPGSIDPDALDETRDGVSVQQLTSGGGGML
jgi:tagatose 6-phosphate kinase